MRNSHWYEAYDDPELQGVLLTNYNATRSIFEDILVIKDRESKLEDRMKRYLDRKGQPREYKYKIDEHDFDDLWLFDELKPGGEDTPHIDGSGAAGVTFSNQMLC